VSLPGESASALATRLALAKAGAVADRCPQDLVIGSDQVAACGGEMLGKPGNHARALEQLRSCSGRSVHFYTAVALVCRESGLQETWVEPVRVAFRDLTRLQIEDYLRREQPYDCAGSFKCEGLGITLFEAIESLDSTALEGLPLIALCTLLARAGVPVLGAAPGSALDETL
jgi:septum formation protein